MSLTRMQRRLFPYLVTGLVWVASHGPRVCADDRVEFFENRIRPLLIEKCVACHAGATPEGDLRVDSLAAMEQGGMTGAAIIPGRAELSLLLQRVTTDDADQRMPPEDPLSAQQIADLTVWINAGAVWPDGTAWDTTADRGSHWAFQPLQAPTPPTAALAEWNANPIDQFIAASYEARGVVPVEPATKRTLIRRATLDLTGLLPTIEETAAFLADESPEAFATVVDRLLASPAYGERWGRHWLDLARYADTSGDGTDTPIPEARYYRDYVIRSLNEDLPCDQFLVEQIAGDILARRDPDHPRYNDRIIATGYIALSRRFGNSAYAEMNLIIDDTIDTIGKSTLGLTLGCARCHHHKFDPITLEDYYGLYGYFDNTQYPHAGTEHQKDREHFVALRRDAGLPADYDSLDAWAVADKDTLTGDASIQIGGDMSQKGESARRGFLSALSDEYPDIPADTSGRLQFANWLVSDANPLTPRVMANRVWQYHFGRGLVATSSNFGRQGSPPDHPDLLEWLATDFVSHGWSFRHLHRRILLSRTWQLSSAADEQNLVRDEANTGYWRTERRRMDAESIRDSLLQASQLLEPGDGGRHPFAATAKLKYSQGRPFMETFDHRHRSVYLMTTRLQKHPFLALFDGPDPNKTTDNRRESTVSLQALYMMNSPFLKEVSAAFSERLATFSSEPELRIRHAYEVALSRPPEDSELTEALGFLEEYRTRLLSDGRTPEAAEQLAWTALSRVLLSSNEFIYVD